MWKYIPDVARSDADTDPNADADTNADANPDADANTHTHTNPDADAWRVSHLHHDHTESSAVDGWRRGGL